MSLSHKTHSTQMLHLFLYQRALHPELFELHIRRTDRHGDYEVESWLINGGHLVRFRVEDQVLAEVVLEQADHLPETGLVYALPCLGEKEYEMEPVAGMGYVTTIQTEILSDNLFTATYHEMQDFARESGAVSREWADEDNAFSLSILDTQKYRKEFHLQSYHLLGKLNLVLRTQSIFEIVN